LKVEQEEVDALQEPEEEEIPDSDIQSDMERLD